MISHSIHPRYSPGSPSVVPRDVAERVLLEERSAHQRALSGRYGEERRALAQRLGLSGIVESLTERRGKIVVSDLLTGEVATMTLTERHRQVAERRAARKASRAA
jgi:hypothetical protein